MKAERSKQKPIKLNKNVKAIAISIGVGIALCSLMLLIFSFIVSSNDVPQGLIYPMTIFAACLSGFVSGYVVSRIIRKNGLAWGALCGLILFVVVAIVDFAIGFNGFGILGLIKLLVLLLSSAIGGFIGVNRKKKLK